MSRIIFPEGNFAVNAIAAEPPLTVPWDLWAYFGGSAAASPNLVGNTPLAVTGTPVWSEKFVTLTPATNYLTPTGVLDTADREFLLVARTQQTGGNWSPFISAYGGGTGLMIGLGWNQVRMHASGLSALINHVFAGNYHLDWSLISITIDSGAAVPITIRNHTHDQTVTGGTALADRTNTGGQITLGGHSALNGTFTGDLAFVGSTPVIPTTDERAQAIKSVRLDFADMGILV